LDASTAAAPAAHQEGDGHDHDHVESGLPRLIGELIFAVAAEAVAFFAPETALLKDVQMLLAAPAIFLAGFGTYQKGLRALKAGRLNINALMTVAVTGAFAIGQWPEAAMVMALYAIAELIEARAVDRARNAIKSLLDLAPQDAEVQQTNGQWQRMPTAAVAVGAVVRLRPGERVPLDGMVTAGASAIDQAPVTGESVPVDKTVGDEVFAGTINQNAALELRVTALATDSTLARIIHAVEEAQATRAPPSASSIASPPFTRQGCSAGPGCRAADALVDGLDLDAGGLQGPGPAGHCLSLRPSDLDPGDRGQRPGSGDASRHPD